MADNYLITGYWGEPHITPENDRGINASIFGTGKFVLPVGEMFRAEIVGSNTLRLYDGKLMINGAAAGIPAGEYVDLSVPYASQGMWRSDLVVFQYEKDPSTLVETGKFVVVHGEEVAFPAELGDNSTPPDPALTTDNLLSDKAIFDQFPLWRVTVLENAITIINAQNIERDKLFSLRPNATYNSLEELGISDDDMEPDTPELISDGPFSDNIMTIVKALPNYAKLKMLVSSATMPNLYNSLVGKINLDTWMAMSYTSQGGTTYAIVFEVSKSAGVYVPVKIDLIIDGGNRDSVYSCVWDATSAGTVRCSRLAPSYTAGAAPAMKDGVEYMTDEYWGGKVLYTRMFSFTWTAGGTLDFSISPTVVRYTGRVGAYALPFIYGTLDDTYTAFCCLYEHNGKLRMLMQGSNTHNNTKAYLQVWYTK